MKSLLVLIVASVLLVGCGESQPPTTDSVDPRVANYDPNKSWGLSDEEKAAEDEAQKAKPEPTTVKAPDISLFDAAGDGNIEAVKQHLAAGADVDAKGGWLGGTPLHYAVGKGHKEIVELLIAKGADVHEKAKDGTTPLHSATTKEIAELLITEGADVNPQSKIFGTPLDLAIQVKNTKTATFLRKHGGKTGAELKAAAN